MFKLLTAPFRWILKIVLSIVIFVTVIVGVVFGLLYKNATPPTVTDDDLVLIEYIEYELEEFADPNNENKVIELFLTEEVIYKEVYKLFNLEPGVDDNAMEWGPLKLKGVWMEFGDDNVEVIVSAHVSLSFFTFKTRILVSFDILESSSSELKLKLDKVKLGNIPLAWAIKLVPKLSKDAMDDFLNTAMENIGTYDLDGQILTIDIKKIINTSDDLSIGILDLIDDNDLFTIGTRKKNDVYGLYALVDLNKTKSDKEAIIVSGNDKINNDDDFNDFLSSKVITNLFETGNKIYFDDFELTRILDFMLKDNVVDNSLFKLPFLTSQEVSLGVPYVEFVGSKSFVNIPVNLNNDGGTFNSNVIIDVSFVKDSNNLVIEVNDLFVGDLEINETLRNALLSNVIDDGNDGIVIDDFFLKFSEAGIIVESLSVEDSLIMFTFENINVHELISDVINVFENVDFNDILEELDNHLDSGDIEDIIDALEDAFDNLTEEEKSDLMDLINSFMN